MIYTWTWIWLAVDGPGGGAQDVSTGKWTGKEIQRRVFAFFIGSSERVMKPVLWKRGDCVAWRRLQQDVSISKWTGKESQQRLSLPCARYEASAGAKEEMVFYVSSGGFLKVFH